MLGIDMREIIGPAAMVVGTVAGGAYGYHIASGNIPTKQQLEASTQQLHEAQKALSETTPQDTCAHVVVSTLVDFDNPNHVQLTKNKLSKNFESTCNMPNGDAESLGNIIIDRFGVVKSLANQLESQKGAITNEARNKIILTTIFGLVGTGLGFATKDIIEGGYH